MPQTNHPEQSPATLFGVNSPMMNPMHAPSPSSFMPTPSPGPSQHMPSSHSMPSPATNYGISQSHDPSQVNSPFQHGSSGISMSSPGAAWPGSPSIPRPSPSRPLGSVQSPASCGQPLGIGQSPQTPNSHGTMATHQQQANQPQMGQNFQAAASRHLPQKPWAAAVPTLLTHQGFDQMCRPGADATMGQSLYGNINQSLSQLDRFLGCVSVRRHLQRVIGQDDQVTRGAQLSVTHDICLTTSSPSPCHPSPASSSSKMK